MDKLLDISSLAQHPEPNYLLVFSSKKDDFSIRDPAHPCLKTVTCNFFLLTSFKNKVVIKHATCNFFRFTSVNATVGSAPGPYITWLLWCGGIATDFAS